MINHTISRHYIGSRLYLADTFAEAQTKAIENHVVKLKLTGQLLPWRRVRGTQTPASVANARSAVARDGESRIAGGRGRTAMPRGDRRVRDGEREAERQRAKASRRRERCARGAVLRRGVEEAERCAERGVEARC
ncbi:hypothetical protein Syun_027614 [Stephania yunnanensis]|uniref:Uncharacterized protein n=1 Tax=Stephania yunnanensis TaxID=152371 RepID=A0AAP0ELE6_9MAGN